MQNIGNSKHLAKVFNIVSKKGAFQNTFPGFFFILENRFSMETNI